MSRKEYSEKTAGKIQDAQELLDQYVQSDRVKNSIGI